MKQLELVRSSQSVTGSLGEFRVIQERMWSQAGLRSATATMENNGMMHSSKIIPIHCSLAL